VVLFLHGSVAKKLKRASAVRKTARAKESLGYIHDNTTLPPVQNVTLKEPTLAPSVALVVVAPDGRYLGLGFRVQGLGFGVWGLRFSIQGLRLTDRVVLAGILAVGVAGKRVVTP